MYVQLTQSLLLTSVRIQGIGRSQTVNDPWFGPQTVRSPSLMDVLVRDDDPGWGMDFVDDIVLTQTLSDTTRMQEYTIPQQSQKRGTFVMIDFKGVFNSPTTRYMGVVGIEIWGTA